LVNRLGTVHHDSERVSARSSDPAAAGPDVPAAPAAASMVPSSEIESPECTAIEPPAVEATSCAQDPLPCATSTAALVPETEMSEPPSVTTLPRSAKSCTVPPPFSVPRFKLGVDGLDTKVPDTSMTPALPSSIR